MYSMKEVCMKIGMPYETLKCYCNEGLIPNVKRDKNNYRIFDESSIEWIKNLICLKRCGMGMDEMKEYVDLCYKGESSVLTRKIMLQMKKKTLQKKLDDIQESIDYIDKKQKFYNGVLDGKIKYESSMEDGDKK